MWLFPLKIIIGMLVGVLVGLTGLGAGVLLLPILIFGLGIPPIVAVGSDAAFNAITKIGAGYLHWKRRTVDWRLIAGLSIGSIPAALGGILLITHLRVRYGNELNSILRSSIGVLLVLIPLLLLLQRSPQQCAVLPSRAGQRFWRRVALVGLIAGFLIGVSSIGSGTIVMLLLALLVQSAPATLVGTDIVHAVIVTGFTSVFYFRLGAIDTALLIPLLIGSIPGALLGVRLATRLPALYLRRVLCVSLILTGAKMLWA
jgi:uncharacterized membrane protein YfcA